MAGLIRVHVPGYVPGSPDVDPGVVNPNPPPAQAGAHPGSVPTALPALCRGSQKCPGLLVHTAVAPWMSSCSRTRAVRQPTSRRWRFTSLPIAAQTFSGDHQSDDGFCAVSVQLLSTTYSDPATPAGPGLLQLSIASPPALSCSQPLQIRSSWLRWLLSTCLSASASGGAGRTSLP